MVKLEKLHVSYEKFLEHMNWSLNGLEDILAAHPRSHGKHPAQPSMSCEWFGEAKQPPRDTH